MLVDPLELYDAVSYRADDLREVLQRLPVCEDKEAALRCHEETIRYARKSFERSF